MLLDGANEIMDTLNSSATILEIGCGNGELAAFIAQQLPSVKIIAIDIDQEKLIVAKEKYGHVPNVSFECADIFSTFKHNKFYKNGFDVVYGQAILHHIQHNISIASEVISLLLKKNGKCVFIFEPWGLNPLVSATRAALNSFYKHIDEANLYDNILKLFLKNFQDYRISYYNFIGYFGKVLPQSFMSYYAAKCLHFIDKIIFKLIPALRKYTANINVVFYK